MSRMLFADESGAVTTDWVALTAGILLLGTIVVMTVMENSGGHLMDQFESLNEQYAEESVAISVLQDDINDGQ